MRFTLAGGKQIKRNKNTAPAATGTMDPAGIGTKSNPNRYIIPLSAPLFQQGYFCTLKGVNMATKTNTTVNGKNYFRLRRTVDGKQKNFYGTSKGDAEKKYKQFLEERAREKYEKAQYYSSATIHERAKEFIDNSLSVSQKYARGTRERYESAYRTHISGTDFDKMAASDVRAADIQKFYNELPVSAQTLKSVSKFMSAFWKWLVLNDYAPNVIVAVDLPIKPDNSRHSGIQIWEDKEIHKILMNIDKTEYFRISFMVKVLLYTGMRIGEVLALRYSDIKDGYIHVNRQVYMDEIKQPKYNSARTIPLHDALAEALEKHKEWHRQEMLNRDYKTPYIFTTSKGTLYGVSNIRRRINRFYDAINVPHKNIHTYRSTFCTQMCRCDVPLEVASKLLGHKSLEVTAKHYQMIKNDTMEEAIEKFVY